MNTSLASRLLLTLAITASCATAQPAKEAPKPAAPKAQAPKADAPKEKPKTPSATEPVDRKDQWWQDRHASFNAKVKQAAEKGDAQVLFIGDSITQGWEGEGKDVWAANFAKFGAINLGIGGDRTEHVLWRMDHGNLDGLDKPKAGAAPKVAVIMIGTNNCANTEPTDTAAGITAIVGKVQAKVPGIKVLLLAIFPREEKPGTLRAKNSKVNEIVSKLDDGKHVFFMDIGANFTEKDGSLTKQIMPDFLHLSPEGYARWAKAIEPKLAELTK
jgi:lysophospholipase L1-like esterase